jgi:hypothetical protein
MNRLDLTRTGRRCDLPDLGFYLLEVPEAEKGPWSIVIADGSDFFAELTEELAHDASEGGEVLYFWCSDTTMNSEIVCLRDRRVIWAIRYDCEGSSPQPKLEGEVPNDAQEVLDSMLEAQRESDEAGDDVDHLYEITALAGRIWTGFKHDAGANCEDPEPFQVLERHA